MDNPTHPSGFNRRDAMKMLGAGSAAGLLGLFGATRAGAAPRNTPTYALRETPSYAAGMPPVKIKSVKAIGTAPQGSNLIIVKVETTEPGLYGIGCATFTQRAELVVTPENMDWFKQLRASTTVPFAMGELFNNLNEFVGPMVDRSFDYIRCHVSQIGGITPAMKVARLGEFFNVKSGWHGPGDVSPVGHAAHCHIDMAIWNFGVPESVFFSDKLLEVFPGSPELKKGYMYLNDSPGLGIDINEKLAEKYPINNKAGNWTLRKRDGTIIRP